MGRITGERVVLREFRAEDLSGMRSWITDKRTTRYLSTIFMKPQTWEQTESYLRGLLEGDAGGVNLVISDKADLRYLGQCNLMMIDQTARKAELAVVLAFENIGKGYGGEAVRLLLSFAFNQMNLHRVFLKVHAENQTAIHLYERLGFAHEGRLRDEHYADGHYSDILVMGILREEFEAHV